MIDSHMHINYLLTQNNELLINKINSNISIDAVINVGLNINTSNECVNMSNNNNKFYSSIGIHPLYINEEKIDSLYKLYDDKVVAIGEIGLDFFNKNHDLQIKYFIHQILIANELKLPIIIHSNNTNNEVINILKKYNPKYGCVFHCFQPDLELLDCIIKNGWYISFAGKITYKNANKSLEVIKLIPNDLFLVETDSPYFSPEPLRSNINESSNLKYILKKISELKECNYEYIENITISNTKRLFKKIK